MNPEKIAQLKDMALQMAVQYAPKLALAVLTLVIGWSLIKFVLKLVQKALMLRAVDPTLAPFLNSVVGWGLKVVLLISVASMVGIQTTSFVAVMGAAGLAVGLALQGSLANFAGGVLILMFRPYRVGDVIQAQGEVGEVKEIQIFTTIMVNAQNRRVIIPNGPLANGNIINLTAEPHVRVDTVVGISYSADMKKARDLLLGMVKEIPGVLAEPEPVVAVTALGPSSVDLIVRPFCKPSDYWSVHFATVEGTKRTLDAAGISIPFPQREVHVFKEN